jgi:hypothetical protein
VLKKVYSAGQGFMTATTPIGAHLEDATPMSIDERTDYIASEHSKTPPSPGGDITASRHSFSASSPASDMASMYSGSMKADHLRRTTVSVLKPRTDKVHSIVVAGPPGCASFRDSGKHV